MDGMGEVEELSSQKWSDDECDSYDTGVKTIATVCFWKYEIPHRQGDDHADSPEIWKREEPTCGFLRLHPAKIGSLGEREFEDHERTSKWTQYDGHNTSTPEAYME